MRRYRDYLEQNLFRLSQIIQESMFAEEAAARDGWLQKMDPRLKIIGLLLLILSCSFQHNIVPILTLLLLSLALVAGSSLLSFSYFRRLWFFIPLYTTVIALPALFLTPGEPLFTFPGTGWFVTRQGAGTAILLVTRVTTSVSFLLVLILT